MAMVHDPSPIETSSVTFSQFEGPHASPTCLGSGEAQKFGGFNPTKYRSNWIISPRFGVKINIKQTPPPSLQNDLCSNISCLYLGLYLANLIPGEKKKVTLRNRP